MNTKRAFRGNVKKKMTKINIYEPLGEEMYCPVLYLIHSGEKDSMCTQLAKQGILVVTRESQNPGHSYDYVLEITLMVALLVLLATRKLHILWVTIGVFIASLSILLRECTRREHDGVADVRNVVGMARDIQWIVEHAAEHRGDPTCLFVMGYDDGAYYASLLATDRSYLENYGLDATQCIKGVIAIDGLYSDKRLERYVSDDTMFPIYHVSDDTPPFLLLNSEYAVKRHPHSYDFHFLLLQHGVYSEIDYIAGRALGNVCQEWSGRNRRTMSRALDFIENVSDFHRHKK